MPVEVESTSQLEDVVRVVRKRIGWLLVPLSLCLALGTSFAFLVPKKYVSREAVMVRDVGGRDRQPRGSTGGQVASHVIRAPKRVKAVIESLRWPWAALTKVEKEKFLERTIDNLSVSSPVLGASVKEQIVTISFAHTDPVKALRFTSEISRLWREEVLEASRKATESAYEKLRERRGQMQNRLAAISEELATKHKQYGIPPWDTVAWGERPLAPAFDELISLRAERATVAKALILRGEQVTGLEEAYSKMEDMVPFQATAAGQTYQARIEKIQGLVRDDQLLLTTQGYRPGHSKFVQIQDRINGYKEELALLTGALSGSVVPPEMEQNRAKLIAGEALRLAERDVERMVAKLEGLDAGLRNTEAHTRELQTIYQELHDLQAERVRVNGNLAQAEDEFTRKEVEWTEMKSAAGNPFNLLRQAELPTRPTEPSVPLIILGSAVLGLALGLGGAFLAEYGRNCFRTVNDITRVMIVPVLGTVNTIVTSNERRRVRLARILIGGSTLLVIGALGFITYAWEVNQSLLSDDLRMSLESFRRAFE
jgi:uncharacterized protein involved in exopolysaccharide biosynthesis